MPQELGPFKALQRFEDRIPQNPYCSSTKRLQYILPKEQALGFPYVQVNFPNIDYLCFDLDYPGAPIAHEDHDLPRPTLTVITPDTHHAHLLYELYDPIPRDPSKATKALLKDVIWGYREALYADRAITTQKQLVKNALHNKWDVIAGNRAFALSELALSIPYGVTRLRDFTPPIGKGVREKPFEETLNRSSRNCSLFESVRLYAYTIVRESANYDSFYSAILERIEHLNHVEVPKYFKGTKIHSTGELRSIARSIANWTWQRRSGFKQVNAGAMGFKSMKGVYCQRDKYEREVKRRRKLSANRTHQIRKGATRKKIADAVELCFKRGVEPTVANIAAFARIHHSTIYRTKDYRILISDLIYQICAYGLSGN